MFANIGNTDQHSKIGTFNIAPAYTHVISNNAVFNFGAYVRKDQYNYYPSSNPLADLNPIQTQSISQYRTLTNAGTRSDVTYAKGIHNIKAGVTYQQTFLRENDKLGVVDATYNAPCADGDGNPLPGYSDPSACDGIASFQNPNYLPVLAPVRPDPQRGLLQLFRPYRC